MSLSGGMARILFPLVLGTLPAPVQAPGLIPGLYELTTTGANTALSSSTRACISAKRAQGAFARPLPAAGCRMEKDLVSRGRIEIVMRCGPADHGHSLTEITGAYTERTFEIRTRTLGSDGGSPREMRVTTQGRRLGGPCTL